MTRSLGSVAFINFVANGVAAVLSAVALLVSARILGASDWGHAVALLGLGQFLGGVVNWGTSVRALRELSFGDGGPAYSAAVRFVRTRLASTLLVLILGVLLSLWDEAVLLVITVMAGSYAGLATVIPMLARRRYVTAAFLLLAEKSLAMTVIIVLAAYGTLNGGLVLLVIGLAGILGLILGYVVLRVQGKGQDLDHFDRFRWRHILGQWEGARHFGIASVAPSALLLDVAIVGAMAGPTQAGLYAAGSRLAGPLAVAATTVAQVLMPAVARSDSRKINIDWNVRSLSGLALLMLALTAAIIYVPLVIVLLIGDEYADSVEIIRVFVANAGVVLITRSLVTVLQAWGAEAIAAKLVACQVLIAVAWIWGTASSGGAVLAAWGTFSSNLLLVVALAIAVKGQSELGK